MRTLLLGLDGLDPGLVEEFDLPNIKSIGEGFEIDTHGNSGPSWVSVMTGRKPKDHGVFTLKPQQNVQTWTGTPIWEKVDGYSGIANIPLTYPPDREIDGWMVTGMMSPENAIYTSPRNLYKKLDGMGYRIDFWAEPGDHENHPHGHYGTVPTFFSQEYRDDALKSLEMVIERRGEAFRWLIQNEPVDFSFLVYTSLDRVQHFVMDEMDIVEKFYKQIDDEVGKLLKILDSHVEIYLTSDHGFRLIDTNNTDIVGEHRIEGYGATNTGEQFANLEELHELAVNSANRSNVEGRLRDLGYIE